jgi:hypothetical protein
MAKCRIEPKQDCCPNRIFEVVFRVTIRQRLVLTSRFLRKRNCQAPPAGEFDEFHRKLGHAVQIEPGL